MTITTTRGDTHDFYHPVLIEPRQDADDQTALLIGGSGQRRKRFRAEDIVEVELQFPNYALTIVFASLAAGAATGLGFVLVTSAAD